MKKHILFTFLFTFISSSHADEIPIPDFKSEPMQYIDSHGGKLLIGERTPEKLKFWFRVMGGNYHQCHMSGVATSIDNETYKFSTHQSRAGKPLFCSLSIITLNESVVLIDHSGQCTQISCGQRASISGAVFHAYK